MISYLIYQLLQLPFLFIRPDRLKKLFVVKSVVLPPAIIAMTVYLAVKAGGGSEFFHEPGTLKGSARAWQWLSGMTSVIGGCATLVRST